MDTAQHTGKCEGCGRPIWSAVSLAAGRGSGCRAKLRKAAKTADLTAFHPWQVTKARDAIETGAIVPLSRPGMYAAVSSGGPVRKADPEPVVVYVVDAIERSCTCKAAMHGHRCYHLAGAVILFAAASGSTSTRKAA